MSNSDAAGARDKASVCREEKTRSKLKQRRNSNAQNKAPWKLVTCGAKAVALPSSGKIQVKNRYGVLGIDWKDEHITLEKTTKPPARQV